MPVVLRGDNAFLNGGGSTASQLRAEWLAAGKTFTNTSTAQVGKFWQEFGGRDVKTEREQYRLATGFEGKFQTFGRDVNIDGYAQYSRLDGTTTSYSVPTPARAGSTDAVLIGGVAVCRASPAAPGRLRAVGPGRTASPSHPVDQRRRPPPRVKQTVAGLNFATDLSTCRPARWAWLRRASTARNRASSTRTPWARRARCSSTPSARRGRPARVKNLRRSASRS
jgi:hypothetical protein